MLTCGTKVICCIFFTSTLFTCPQDSVFCPCQHHSNSYIPVCCTIFSCEHFHVNMIPHVFRVNTIPTRISQSVPNLFPCQKDSMCFYVIPISISLSVAQSFHVSMIAHVLHVNQTIPHLYL
jgi:hypothetical protein